MIKLGQEVKDKVTGFIGIATARVVYLNGCIQYCLKPKMTDNKFPDGQYIDDTTLEVVGKGLYVEPKETGGPSSDCPSDSYRG